MLSPKPLPPLPADTAKITHAAFPEGHPLLQQTLRQHKLGDILVLDDDLAHPGRIVLHRVDDGAHPTFDPMLQVGNRPGRVVADRG